MPGRSNDWSRRTAPPPGKTRRSHAGRAIAEAAERRPPRSAYGLCRAMGRSHRGSSHHHPPARKSPCRCVRAEARRSHARAVRLVLELPQGSTTFVGRDEDGERNGPGRPHRIHVDMSRRPGDDATRWLSTAARSSPPPPRVATSRRGVFDQDRPRSRHDVGTAPRITLFSRRRSARSELSSPVDVFVLRRLPFRPIDQ